MNASTHRSLRLALLAAIALLAPLVAPSAGLAYPLTQSGSVATTADPTSRLTTLVAPSGAYVYTSGSAMDGANAVVTKTRTLDMKNVDTATFAAAAGVYGSAISPNGRYGYFSGYAGTLTKVDLSTMTVVGSADLTITGALAVALAPDGSTAYVSSDPGKLVKVNVRTMTQSGAAIDLPSGAAYIGFAEPSGRYVYFATEYVTPGVIAKVDVSGATPAVTASYSIPAGTHDEQIVDAAISPNGAFAYLAVDANNGSCTAPAIRKIDLASLTQVGPARPLAAALGCPIALAATPDGDIAVATGGDPAHHAVALISSATFALLAGPTTIDSPASTNSAAVSDDSAFLYIGGAINPAARVLQVYLPEDPPAATKVRASATYAEQNVTVTMRVTTTGAGAISALVREQGRSAKLCTATGAAITAGTVEVSCKLGRAVRTRLRADGLTLAIRATLTPVVGDRTTATATKTLSRRP